MGHENGHAPEDLDAEDLPLDPDEAAAGAATAGRPGRRDARRAGRRGDRRAGRGGRAPGRRERVVRRGRGRVRGLGGDGLEVALDATVLKAALKTPDTAASVRAPGGSRSRPRPSTGSRSTARRRGSASPTGAPRAADRGFSDRAASQTALADVEWDRACSSRRQTTPGGTDPVPTRSLRARIGTPGDPRPPNARARSRRRT